MTGLPQLTNVEILMLSAMPVTLKNVVKPFVPEAVLERWRRMRFHVEQKQAAGRPLQDVFSEIYEKGMWAQTEGVRYHSGPGSEAAVTRGYEDFVVAYLDAHPEVQTLLDIGCGDFQVSNRILARVSRPLRYIGCDIAPAVVAHNTATFGQPGRIEFRHLNVADAQLPKADLVTVREVFQHLSNETILAALTNLRRAVPRAIITESLFMKPAAPNLDIVSGYRTRDGLKSGVYLDLPPFNLKISDRYNMPVNDDEQLTTLVVDL